MFAVLNNQTLLIMTNLIPNKHKIYAITTDKFLIVYKVRGEAPTRWQKSILTPAELYREVKNYGIDNAFLNYFKNNNEFYILFSYCDNYNDFLSGLNRLKIDMGIVNILNSANVEIFNAEFYKSLPVTVKKDMIFNVEKYEIYTFFK